MGNGDGKLCVKVQFDEELKEAIKDIAKRLNDMERRLRRLEIKSTACR